VLSASRLQLGAQLAGKVDLANLTVRLINSGSTVADGALEIVTPPGVDLVAFPSICKTHRRITADRDRCEVGMIAAGKEVNAAFGVSISPQARAEVPLTGAVHGYLTPSGQNPVEVQTSYQIVAAPAAGESPLSTALPSGPNVEPAAGGGGGEPAAADHAVGLLTGSRLSILPIVGGIVLLVTLVGLAVVLSLRRRLRDDVPGAEQQPTAGEPTALDGTDEAAPDEQVPPFRALPRRLPTGPVAGPAARYMFDGDDEDDEFDDPDSRS
jgi:hypothetical protein